MGLHKNEPASLLGVVGARVVHIGDLYIYYLHPSVLPLGLKPRPGYCQRDSLEHSQQYGNKNRFAMERKHLGNRTGL